MTLAAPAADARRRLPLGEFIALMAMLVATIAFSIDAMLPALPEMARDLAPSDPNDVQLVIVAFVLGMGAATLVVGPLSDAYGRKPVMLWGAVLYCLGAYLATVAPTLEGLLAARVLQGIGAAGPRIAAMAMVRDLYAGRGMARVSSFIMMTFTLVPAFAPAIGAGIIALSGWRGVFWAFVLFAVISHSWLAIRQPETLAPAARRPMRLTPLLAAAREVVGNGNVRRAVMAQTLVFGILFSTLVSVQPIYDRTFDRVDSFPFWFGGVALVSGLASLLNAQLVERLGMLWLLRRALAGHAILSVVFLAAWLLAPESLRFAIFLIWQTGSFALAGLTIGNLNAIAMEPLGHVAGLASSIVSAVATIGAVCIAVPVGQAFDGTPLPVVGGVALLSAATFALTLRLRE